LQIVVADTSPIHYLILIGHIDVVPALFERVILPTAVRDELAAPKASALVRDWIAASPAWVEIRDPSRHLSDPNVDELDRGERAAITLATELDADLLLIDDRDGVAVARERGFRVAGTLAVLAMAAEKELLDLVQAVDHLKKTNFRYRQDLIDRFFRQHGRKA
jgi:predicted nucleic acid-binding protein